ncbi:MAG: NAD(P)H-dependent oxidoreductase [Candidatus Obscuribacterales bacterium]|jgi:FMN-dependent NADH-azoreductase
MTKVLCIDSSSRTATSVTRQLTEAYLARFRSAFPAAQIVHHDLVAENLPYVSEAAIAALYTAADQRNPEMEALYKESIVFADELVAADLIVLGAPMYNFSVPAVLKAYIDMIVLPGKTFEYDGGAPVALLAGQKKKVIIFTASGGNYDQLPYKAADFLEPYLRTVLGFIGIDDVTFVKVQGHDEALVQEQTAQALAKIDKLVEQVTVQLVGQLADQAAAI